MNYRLLSTAVDMNYSHNTHCFTLIRTAGGDDSQGSVCILHSGEKDECVRVQMSEMTFGTKLERLRRGDLFGHNVASGR